MILLGLGANMPSRVGPPELTLRAALEKMREYGIIPQHVSSFYRTAPVPASDQPWFVNAVAGVETTLSPEAVMHALLKIEKDFGRVRSVKNAPRILDLDLLDYQGQIISTPALDLPHPRLHERAFVLYPLRDLVPDWQHPVTGEKVQTLIAALPSQDIQAAFGQG